MTIMLRPAEIEAELAALGLGHYRLLYHPETQSTNIDVLQYYEQTRRSSIATCETQTAGKGRRGRHWLSPYAENIYCTIGTIKSLPASQLGLLSIVSGVALCRALTTYGIEGIQLKWPNDVIYPKNNAQFCKLGGLLIESRPADNAYFLAIGFGLNVHMTHADLDSIEQAATSLCFIADKPLKRQVILLMAIDAIISAIHQFNGTQVAELVAEFNQFDAFYAQPVCVLEAGKQIFGNHAGINDSGQLLLQTEQDLLSFSAADISLRAAKL